MNKYGTYIKFDGESFKNTYPNKKFYIVANKQYKINNYNFID